MKRILVAGGAGYIGSHMVKMLLAEGRNVVTLDDFSTGHRDAVPGGEIVEGSIGDYALLKRMFSARDFDAVMHFASYIQVGESVSAPAKYYANNVANTIAAQAAIGSGLGPGAISYVLGIAKAYAPEDLIGKEVAIIANLDPREFTLRQSSGQVAMTSQGMILAAHGEGRRDEALATELERLREEAERFGFRIALPAIKAALLGGDRDLF